MQTFLLKIWNYLRSFFQSTEEYVEHAVEQYEKLYDDVRDAEYTPGIIDKPSPNFNQRPPAAVIIGIVIHAAGEIIDGLPAVEFMEKNKLSYHAVVHPDGLVTTTVSPERRAWHAGVSRWEGITNLNNTYIGYCLLVPGSYSGATWNKFVTAMNDPKTYSEEQYKSMAWLCRKAQRKYPNIAKSRILGHSDVSGREVRPDFKSDPGKGFDMERLKELI